MSPQEHSKITITCMYCGKQFQVSPRVKRKRTFCSRTCALAYQRELPRVTKQCAQCGQTFTFRSMGARNNAKRRFCSTHCAATWRMAQPGRKERFDQAVAPFRGVVVRGKKNPAAAARMRTHNPMRDPQTREKVRQALTGRTFLARGGNGKPTIPQLLLAEATGFPMEYVIVTAPVADQFPSLPHAYKVDLADPSHKLAIEVDGKTHRLKKWRYLDQRKTEVLHALGWSVLRFWNQQILEDLPAVLATIHAYIASK